MALSMNGCYNAINDSMVFLTDSDCIHQTLDSILDDDSRPKKTVSFNKDVKVYAGAVIDEGNNGLGEHDRDKDGEFKFESTDNNR